MSIDKEILDFACQFIPEKATIVPERRQEITTEGGLDLRKGYNRIAKAVSLLRAKEIDVSLFIDANKKDILLAKKIGVSTIELHTGPYANAKTQKQIKTQLRKIEEAAFYAYSLGLFVAAGHGLNYDNVEPIAKIKHIEELNIGHSIIAQAVFIGIKPAVQLMLRLIKQ
jgi:pyridoxine 5-phosphate synthase